MLFYLAKIIEGLGITIIAAGFLVSFPELMSMQYFMFGLGIFLVGWLIERFR